MKRIPLWSRALAGPGAVVQELNEEIRDHAALALVLAVVGVYVVAPPRSPFPLWHGSIPCLSIG